MQIIPLKFSNLAKNGAFVFLPLPPTNRYNKCANILDVNVLKSHHHEIKIKRTVFSESLIDNNKGISQANCAHFFYKQIDEQMWNLSKSYNNNNTIFMIVMCFVRAKPI